MKMTDFEYAKYLFALLWNSDEDCCSKCSRCPNNAEDKDCIAIRSNGTYDTDLCFMGMKHYAEENAEKK